MNQDELFLPFALRNFPGISVTWNVMKRPRSHVIGDKAVSLLKSGLPENWVFREITKDDYGVDAEVEIVEGEDVTGLRVWFQIKGIENVTHVKKKPCAITGANPEPQTCIAFSIETKWLRYSLQCDFPLLLAVVDIQSNKPYWLPARDHIEMILDDESPAWSKQEKATLHLPCENAIEKENKSSIDGLRWYALEPRRMRAFAILNNYYQLSRGLCKEMRQCVSVVGAPEPAAEVLLRELGYAQNYLSRAISMDCVFGNNGIDFFKKLYLPGIRNGIQAIGLLYKCVLQQHTHSRRQNIACVVVAIDQMNALTLGYEAMRRRYLFCTERRHDFKDP